MIFDGRNIFDPDRVKREGFTYFGIGLGEQFADPNESSRRALNLLSGAALAD